MDHWHLYEHGSMAVAHFTPNDTYLPITASDGDGRVLLWNDSFLSPTTPKFVSHHSHWVSRIRRNSFGKTVFPIYSVDFLNKLPDQSLIVYSSNNIKKQSRIKGIDLSHIWSLPLRAETKALKAKSSSSRRASAPGSGYRLHGKVEYQSLVYGRYYYIEIWGVRVRMPVLIFFCSLRPKMFGLTALFRLKLFRHVFAPFGVSGQVVGSARRGQVSAYWVVLPLRAFVRTRFCFALFRIEC